jgi:predicted kinase
MTRPTLVLVSGPPGSGKTTLAHAVAPLVACPVVSRDEIKEGIVHAAGGDRGAWGGPVSKRTFEVFFATIRVLLDGGVTHIAEAAFRTDLSAPELAPFLAIARMRIVHCSVDIAIARSRIERRAHTGARVAHPDDELLAALDDGSLAFRMFDPPPLDVPVLHVDTTDGYHPTLDEIVAFING